MNDKEAWQRKQRLIKFTGFENTSQWNRRKGVQVHGDKYRHFMVKSAVFKVLQEAGHEVRTEVEFPNGFIADVVDATTFYIYEVETKASAKDIVAKIDNFDGFNLIEDVIVLDPTEAPDDLDALQDWVAEKVLR